MQNLSKITLGKLMKMLIKFIKFEIFEKEHSYYFLF